MNYIIIEGRRDFPGVKRAVYSRRMYPQMIINLIAEVTLQQEMKDATG